MARMFVMFNHTLTREQKADAYTSLGVSEIVLPEQGLAHAWANISPELETIDLVLEPFRRWLDADASPGDYVLIQGETGATVLLVSFAASRGLIPVYSTTRRTAFEEVLTRNEVRISHSFRHVRFRTYEV